MTDKILIDRATIQQVSDWFKWFHAGNSLEAVWSSKQCSTALRAALDQPALAQQHCNCRWEGEKQVQQCELHAAHEAAIHDWADRAKTAEAKLAQVHISIPDAMNAVIGAMRSDPEYAWSWHCNVAMSFVDAGGDHYTANQGAARFMKLLAQVDPAHELPEQPNTPAAQKYRDSQEAPFEHWWEKHGQFCRAGGGDYEKTFAWNAWCAAAQKEQP